MLLSPYIITIIMSWIIAQGAKYIVATVKYRTLRAFRQLYLSGNMPSAHAATVMSVTTFVGCREGFDSAVFGVAIMIASIVMYDAVMVRRSVGEQGVAIRELIGATKFKVVIPRAAKGHTPVEVLVGAALGALIGAVVFIATN